MPADARGLWVALETTGRRSFIAVGQTDSPDLVESFEPSRRNAVDLIPQLARVFDRLGRSPQEITTLAISSGPGSFTGLRIGFATAQALVLATGAKAVVVPTTQVLASTAPPEARRIGVVLNTKGSSGYIAIYERAGDDLHEIQPPGTRDASDVLASEPDGSHWLAQKLPEAVIDLGRTRGVRWLLGDEAVCSAEAVYRLGRAAADRGHFSDPGTLVPEYGREPEAVTLWRKRQAEQTPGR
ncbi:tRNA (adenosine(37)-N6)-threonylcarbamoyltransferase complex dimerization subunit type 1 TsaB [Mucisphaera sp.]|uniref:tRNA (adenosine(37)-N6)-threonylcarbamoyltransferase complex dimerization subunit type 1 TsaB n=1 Tax=Mucisphaera sp. TaxID=2913024 RepID=UPI003D09731B